MLGTPEQEWRQLKARYAEMWDEELLDLAEDFKNLTDVAQQVLRDEMKNRNLGDPTAPTLRPEPGPAPAPPAEPSPERQASETVRPVGQQQEREWQRCKQHYAELDNDDLENLADEFEYLAPIAQQVLRDEMLSRGLDDPASRGESAECSDGTTDNEQNPHFAAADMRQQQAEPNEWWVRAFETDDEDLAEQRVIMLVNAGILERWHTDPSGVQIIDVAADQAVEAERILALPVPQSVIDESKIEVPAFEMPRCPRCRASDPVLLTTNPANTWRCESCGHEWSDPIPEVQEA